MLRAIAQARRRPRSRGRIRWLRELKSAVRFRRSYHHVQRSGEHFERLHFEREHFSVHDDVHRFPEIEFDPRQPRGGKPADGGYASRQTSSGRFRTRPPRPMGPQCTYSIEPLSIEACGAIIILPPVYLLLLNATNRQRRSSRSPSARKGNGRRRSRARETSTPDQIAELSQEFQAAIGQRGDVRRETHVQRVDVKKRLARMVQANDVARAPAAGKNGLDGIVRAAVGEVAKEGIARSQREKTQRGAPLRQRLRGIGR